MDRRRLVRKFVAAVALVGFAALPASAQTVKERLPACLACHGENGQSQNPEVPSLGAQQAFYVTVQLLMFRERMRVVDPMNDMAKGLSDDDLRSFADIISKLPPPQPVTGPVDDARMARARPPHRRSARGLPGQGAARLQGQFPPRLRCRHGGCDPADHRRADFGSRLLCRAGEVR
jgi:cytochrome c553